MHKKIQMFALTKTAYNQDVFFLLVIVSFLLLALIKGAYWKHARLFFMGVVAQRYANQYLREENAFVERLNALTFFLMIINFLLLIAKLQSINNLESLLLLLLFLLLFFIVKKLVIIFLGFLFKQNDLAKLTAFFSFLFDKTFGVLLFPLVVIAHFFIFDVSQYVLVITFYLFVIFLFLKLFSLWKIGRSSFGLSSIYIFLYLCLVEISPLLLLAKWILY